MECQWLISLDPAFTLHLDIYFIDLNTSSAISGPGCSSDSLQVGGTLWKWLTSGTRDSLSVLHHNYEMHSESVWYTTGMRDTLRVFDGLLAWRYSESLIRKKYEGHSESVWFTRNIRGALRVFDSLQVRKAPRECFVYSRYEGHSESLWFTTCTRGTRKAFNSLQVRRAVRAIHSL